MPPHTDDLPPDRVLTHHWRTRETALEACGLSLGARQGSRNTLATLVAAAGLAAETDQPWTSFSRRRAWYAARAENGDLTYDAVVAGMKEGVAAGLFIEDRALPNAHLDDVPRQSRFRATPLLVERLEGQRFRYVRPSSSIVMRDDAGRPVDFRETERTHRLRKETDALNEWLSGMRVEVSPDASPEDWQRTPHHLRARKVKDGKETWTYVLPTPTPQIVRVFGRERWDCGGRAYGWWQSLPKERRGELLINGEILIEPDFSALHPTLLYAMKGIRLDFDPYDTQEYARAHCKLALNVLINASSTRAAVDALMWRGGWTETRCYTELLVDEVAQRNEPIAEYLGSDAGVRLMGIDSGMAVDVMRRCRKEGVDCLPVHDSFLTPAKSGNRVTAIMADVLDAARVTISAGTSKTWFKTVPQVARSGPAAPAAPSRPPATRAKAQPESVPVPRAREAGFMPVQTVAAPDAPFARPAPQTALAPSWDRAEREQSMLAYQTRIAVASARDGRVAPWSVEWAMRMDAAQEIARMVSETEWETGRRTFPVGIVPDRLRGEAKPGKAPKGAGRSPRRARPEARA